jgi:hypothetical protein
LAQGYTVRKDIKHYRRNEKADSTGKYPMFIRPDWLAAIEKGK